MLAVLGYHFKVPGFHGGFLGVSMFFVISGYLITSQLLRAEKLDLAELVAFYARRARRIIPLATVVLFVSSLAVRYTLGAERFYSLAWDIIASAAFAGNLPAAATGEYLSGAVLPSPFLHFWSLAVEEQFYLLWPVIILCMTLAFPGRPRRAVLLVSALSVFVVSLTLSILRSGFDPAGSYYMIHTRAWEIALGAIAATISLRSRIVGWFAIPMLVAGFVLLNATSVYPGYLALLPTVATVLLLIGAESTSWIGRILAYKPLRSIGALSFGLYLWHWPVLTIATERFGYLNWLQKGVALVVSVALSIGSYRMLENPVRYSRILRASTRKSLLLLPASLVLATILPSFYVLSPPQIGIIRPSEDALLSIQAKPLPPEISLPRSNPISRSVLLVGDSTLATLRWFSGSSASISGFEYVLDAESCRKLANRSCSGGREGRTPPSVADSISKAKVHDRVVVMAGYHSYPDTIASEFQAVVDAARDRGYKSIVWMTLRESPQYPGVGGDASVYAAFNRSVLSVIDGGGYDDVTVIDWNTYSAAHLEWFVPDGIHTNLRGTLSLGEYISSTMAFLDGRPCPGSPMDTPCKVPVHHTQDDLLGRYGLVDTIEHCYEIGELRQIKCRPDRQQVG